MLARVGVLSVLAFAISVSLSACSKDAPTVTKSLNSPNGGTRPALDSNAKGKDVAITDKNHRISFQPKANTTQRYRIVDHIQRSQDIVDQLFNSPGGKKSSVNETEYYLRQTVREVKKDSSVDIKYRIDSVNFSLKEDTSKISYSSSRPADRKDVRFTEYNIIVGQEFGVIVSKYGEILEMYDLQTMLNSVMKDLPDSMKTDHYKQVTNQQLQLLLQQYVSAAIMHYPNKPLAKDSSWGIHSESNFPVSPAVQFPVSIDSKETVSKFEENGGSVLAVLDAKSVQTPLRTSFEQGGVKASLNDFVAEAASTTDVDDATGVIVKRVMHTRQSYVFKLESQQQPGKIARSAQSSTEETVVDLLE